MKFKKVGENTHGPIVRVFNDRGFCLGEISKWHGLFEAHDWRGDNITRLPWRRRQDAANALVEHFEFEKSLCQ